MQPGSTLKLMHTIGSVMGYECNIPRTDDFIPLRVLHLHSNKARRILDKISNNFLSYNAIILQETVNILNFNKIIQKISNSVLRHLHH